MMEARWVRIEGSRGGPCPCHICSLPTEVLLIILSRMSAFDYLSFRSVCKCWRSAFLECSEIMQNNEEAHNNQHPWFLILSAAQSSVQCNGLYEQPLLHTTGKFGDLSTGRIYTTHIPELCGTRILLSKHGWQLLFIGGDSLLFFFNIFSRARIDIPSMDVSKLCHPVFDVSAPPTSPDCIVFAISCLPSGITFKISICRRGDPTWTSQAYHHARRPSKALFYKFPAVDVAFVDGIWYCLHLFGGFSTYSTATRRWKFWGALCKRTSLAACKPVSYVVRRSGERQQVVLRIHGFGWCEVGLQVPLRVIRNGFDDRTDELEHLLRTDVKRAIAKMQGGLVMDSFPTDAWCCKQESDGSTSFRWHEFGNCLDTWFGFFDQCCSGGSTCSTTMVMWTQPIWVHPSPHLKWNF